MSVWMRCQLSVHTSHRFILFFHLLLQFVVSSHLGGQLLLKQLHISTKDKQWKTELLAIALVLQGRNALHS